VRTTAIPAGAAQRAEALSHMKAWLTHLVEAGPYVLLLVNEPGGGAGHPGSLWLVSAFRALGRPFKKNVQYVVFHRPSAFLKTLLYMLKAFISAKATRKWRMIGTVAEVATATGGEVQLEHLGSALPWVKDV